MNHLTDEQLAQWLAGEADQEIFSHLTGCEQCQTESIALKDGVLRYCMAVRQQSRRAQDAHLKRDFAPRRAFWLHRLRWSGAGVLAILLVVQTAWLMNSHSNLATHPPTVTVHVTSQPSAPLSDDELLEAVNNDLSREVPQALAPVSVITTARNKIASSVGKTSRRKGEKQ